jgi:hypothetical protein
MKQTVSTNDKAAPAGTARLSRLQQDSPLAGHLTQLQAMMNGSPQGQALVQLQEESRHSSRVQTLMGLAANINQGALTPPQDLPQTEHTPSPTQASALPAVAQLGGKGKGKGKGRGKNKSKFNRKNKRLAKEMGFHVSDFGEEVSVGEIVAADEERVVEDMGPHTNHLANRVLPSGKKVALIGENHAETLQEEEQDYFTSHGSRYHHEISSLKQTYQESQDDSLTVQHDISKFAIENIPLRALSQVLEMIEDHKDFATKYIVPIQHFWADGTRLVEQITKAKNPNVRRKRTGKLDKLKETFGEETIPAMKDRNSLYLGSLNSLFDEMEATAAALAETTLNDEASKLDGLLKTAKEDFEAHEGLLSPEVVAVLQTERHFEILEQDVNRLEKFHAQMEELLPALQDFLRKVVGRQSPAAVPLQGTGTDTEDEVTKGRSEAMLNHAVWLSKNTSAGEVVKVGESHIGDMDGVAVDAEKLTIIHKDNYYEMQDATNTKLRKEE